MMGIVRLDVFKLALPGGLVWWNVSGAWVAAKHGALGAPEALPMSMVGPTDWSAGNVERSRVDWFKLHKNRRLLDLPVLAVEAPPPDTGSLLCFIDGQHRITARLELALEEVVAFVIPWHLEELFRLPHGNPNGERQ